MKKENVFKGGIRNPFDQYSGFRFEVMYISEVGTYEYEDESCRASMPTRNILLKTIGWAPVCEQLYCVTYRDNALKNLRIGELISAKLDFHVYKNEKGDYYQSIEATEILTLNDYYASREDNAAFDGRYQAEKQEDD